MDEIKVIKATSDDVYGIRNVQRVTWIDTYPNTELGITKEDIESRFAVDDTEEGKQKMEKRKKRLNDSTTSTLIAKDRNEIVGFCVVRLEPGNKRIGALYVLPNYQGKKIGKRLMEAGLKLLGDNEDIYVDVASYNNKAIDFYKSFGFTESGRDIKNPVADLPSGISIPEIELVKKVR